MPIPKLGRRVYEEHVAKAVTPPAVSPSDSPAPRGEPGKYGPEELDKAAFELVEFLPEDVQNLVKEAREQLNIPMWQVLLGYVMRVAERQELFIPFLLASWESFAKPNAPRVCETCQNEFVSKFPQARYCCPRCHFGKLSTMGHSEGCPTGLAQAIPVASER